MTTYELIEETGETLASLIITPKDLLHRLVACNMLSEENLKHLHTLCNEELDEMINRF